MTCIFLIRLIGCLTTGHKVSCVSRLYGVRHETRRETRPGTNPASGVKS